MPDVDEFLLDFAGDFISIRWTDKSLQQGLADAPKKLHDKLMALMEYEAPGVEAHMKQNAPWTDRTGNARQGLRAQAFDEGDNMGIVLYHQVPYGLWLELKYSGAYAIIGPTIEAKGPEIMRAAEGILGEI